MGDQVTVSFDFAAIDRMIENGDKLAAGAMAASLNKAAMKVRTQATREIASKAGIQPQRLVRRRMKIKRARASKLEAAVTFLLRPIPAIQLSAARRLSPGRRAGGISVGGMSWSTGFIAMGKGGHWQIFRRKPEAKHKKVVGRGGTKGRRGFLGIGRRKATGEEWHALPIEAMKIDIRATAEAVLKNKTQDALRYLKDILPGELVWRMTGGRQGHTEGGV